MAAPGALARKLAPPVSSEIQQYLGAGGEARGPFATSWRAYVDAGLVVIPERDKKGVFNWPKKRPTSDRYYSERAASHGGCGIGILTGLSGLTVIDIDADGDPSKVPALIEKMIALFGPTPIMVETPSGGRHLWYKARPSERCETPHGARRRALPVDVRSAGGFVVAPPTSRGAGRSYRFLTGSLADVARLPLVKEGTLPLHPVGLVEPPVSRGAGSRANPTDRVKVGDRDALMFKLIRGATFDAGSAEDLRNEASRLNVEYCDPPLSQAEINSKVRWCWSRHQTGQLKRPDAGSHVMTTREEHDDLIGEPHTFALLAHLRFSHGAEPGKTFAVSPKGMKAKGPLAQWPIHAIRSARDRLVKLGKLRQVKAGGRGRKDPHLFTLAESYALTEEKGSTGGHNIRNTSPLRVVAITTSSSRRASKRPGGSSFGDQLESTSQQIGVKKPVSSVIKSGAAGAARNLGTVDLVTRAGGDFRPSPVTVAEGREWMAERRLRGRAAAKLAGIPAGSLFAWLGGHQGLSPENEARLRRAVAGVSV